MSRLTVLAALPLLAVISACQQSSNPKEGRLDPPENTGRVFVDMEGEWFVTSVLPEGEIRRPQGRVPTIGAPTFGTTLEILNGQVIRFGNLDLSRRSVERQGCVITTYLNVADGRFLLYDRGHRSPPGMADGGSQRFQLALGTISPDRIAGQLEVHTQSPFTAPGELVRGLYNIAIERNQRTPPDVRPK